MPLTHEQLLQIVEAIRDTADPRVVPLTSQMRPEQLAHFALSSFLALSREDQLHVLAIAKFIIDEREAA